MNKDQKSKLSGLICVFGTASESLGAVDGSYGWNTAYAKQESALIAIMDFLDTLGENK